MRDEGQKTDRGWSGIHKELRNVTWRASSIMAGPSVIQSFLVGAVAGMTHQRGIYRPRPLIASFTTSTTTRESEWSNGEELSNWGVDRFSSPRLSVCMRDDGADHCHQEVPVYRQEGERLEEEGDVFIHMNDAG